MTAGLRTQLTEAAAEAVHTRDVGRLEDIIRLHAAHDISAEQIADALRERSYAVDLRQRPAVLATERLLRLMGYAVGLPAERTVSRYARDMHLLARFDQGTVAERRERPAAKILWREEIDAIVAALREMFPDDNLLGVERAGDVAGIAAQVEQTFAGQALYPSVEKRAAALLYLMVKDHPFVDGNKRVGAMLFARFHQLNQVFPSATLPASSLAPLTLMVAASDPSDKDRVLEFVEGMLAA